jgi:hypothetical protein
MKLFHKIIFWSHLLAGLTGGVVILIMSATGVILMYEHQMVDYAERDVRKIAPPSADARRLSWDEIVAKAVRSETAAKLDLELVPTTPNGNTLMLLFHSAPLAKAEVTLVGPSKWQKPLVTDDKGQITLPTPWAGRYVLEVTHFDDKPGDSGNEKFNRTRHISSLFFVQRDGIPWTDKR